jgi:hypothetical protein
MRYAKILTVALALLPSACGEDATAPEIRTSLDVTVTWPYALEASFASADWTVLQPGAPTHDAQFLLAGELDSQATAVIRVSSTCREGAPITHPYLRLTGHYAESEGPIRQPCTVSLVLACTESPQVLEVPRPAWDWTRSDGSSPYSGWCPPWPERSNLPPTVTILSPGDGEVFHGPDPIVLSGTGQDPEDGTLTGKSLVWLFGTTRVGTGPTLDVDWGWTGSYTVTLLATDSDHGQGSASVTVTIRNRVSFAATVLPFFIDHCAECHGDARAEGGIRLDSHEAITTGGNANGPLVVAGDSNQGILIPRLLAEHFDSGHDGWFVGVHLADWIDDGALDN